MRERVGGVIFHLILSPKPLKNGKYAVYIRVQYQNRNQHFSCNCDMSKEEWAKFEKSPDYGHPVMQTYDLFKRTALNLLRDDSFSLSALSGIIGRCRNGSVQEIFQSRIKEIEATGKFNTSGIYKALLANINEFYGSDSVSVKSITKSDMVDFIRWLQEDRGNKSTTASIKQRTMHAILEIARKDRLIPSNPLDGVRKPFSPKRNMSLSGDSLKKLLTVTREQIGERRFYWLCFWRCMYYANGMNIGDLLRLKFSDVNFARNMIIYHRRKTDKTYRENISIALIPELTAALDVISGGKQHIIPILDGVRENSKQEWRLIRGTYANVNHNLVDICKELGIRESVTTSTGRHAFATRLMQKEVPIVYISRALGHSNIKTTEHYLDDFTEEQSIEYMNRLTK